MMLRKAFPQVTIVCSAVDDDLSERWLECIDVEGEGLQDPGLPVDPAAKEGRKVWVVEPGMGHIGKYHFTVAACEKSLNTMPRRPVLPMNDHVLGDRIMWGNL